MRVVDGDTLWVEVDCGFAVCVKYKLRLRGIDCAELGRPEGRRAKAFVEEVLADSRGAVYEPHDIGLFVNYRQQHPCGAFRLSRHPALVLLYWSNCNASNLPRSRPLSDPKKNTECSP